MFNHFVKGKGRIFIALACVAVLVSAGVLYGRFYNQLVNGGVRAALAAQPSGGANAEAAGGGSTPAALGAGAPAAGFRVDLPPGWHAAAQKDGAVVARSGDGSSAVVIAPALGAGSSSAADWLRRHGAAAIGAYLKNPRIGSVSENNNGAPTALASVEFDGIGAQGKAAAICFLPGGGMGTLYLIAAPKDGFAGQRDGLVHILKSFQFNGVQPAASSAASGVAGNVSYTSLTDPKEGAFTVDVPAGWQVDGGLVRLTAWEYRILLRAVSPDGATVVRLFDPDIGTFTTPTRLMAFAGIREGMPYNLYGNHWLVQRYLPGPQFAEQYAGKMARDFQATDVRMKDVSALPQWTKSGITMGSAWQVTGGQAAFTCQRNGRAYSGWVAAATQEGSIPSTEGALWYARGLMGFLAPTEQAGEADAIVRHMFQSFHMNDQWMMAQSNTAAKNGKIADDAGQKIGQIGIDGYWARKGMQDESARRTDEMVRGVVRLRDPNTGEELEGVAGKNYYYRLPASNNNVGINREIVNPDLTQLEVVQ